MTSAGGNANKFSDDRLAGEIGGKRFHAKTQRTESGKAQRAATLRGFRIEMNIEYFLCGFCFLFFASLRETSSLSLNSTLKRFR
jgi:hypothetical protein